MEIKFSFFIIENKKSSTFRKNNEKKKFTGRRNDGK